MKLVLDFTFTSAFLFNVLILILLTKNSSTELHKRILQIIFLFITVTIIASYAQLNRIRLLYYTTFIFDQSISTFIGPLLMLYVKSIFLPQKGLIKKNKRHFIFPVVFLLAVTLPILISLATKAYLYDYINIYGNYLSLAILYSLVYVIISLRILKKTQEIIKHNYSNLEGVDITWIRHLLIGAIFIISVDVLSTMYELLFGVLEWNTLYLTSIFIVFLVIYLGYHGVLQSKIFISPFFVQKENDITGDNEMIKSPPPKNYSPSELIVLEKQLNILMNGQKLFLDENLSLKSLADLLAVSDKKLSAILNQHMRISFYDYVNGFRVEEVIIKMKDSSYDKYTLLAIAFESGFNSKTSFNRIFKNVTNLSPSEYKKQLQ